jgi:hypothetical protein
MTLVFVEDNANHCFTASKPGLARSIDFRIDLFRGKTIQAQSLGALP